MPHRARELNRLLRRVSRSFYLTLRVLPDAIRPQISLAYLLARATDTVADTRLVPVARRLSSLRELCSAVAETVDGHVARVPDLGELAAAQPAPVGRGSPAEKMLLASMGKVLAALRDFSPEDRRRIGEVLNKIGRGQESDIIRFGQTTVESITSLDSDVELDEYVYCVAGCVGEFWTRMCRAHLFPAAALDDPFLLAGGVAFGKGLQLVNILRDLPADLRQGRCYLPGSRVAECGLQPSDLLDPANMARFRPIYERYLTAAENYLADGWAYTEALPHGQIRVRLACAWPILIGLKTIAHLRSGNVLDEQQRIKVSRSEIRSLIATSLLRYPFADSWDRLFDLARS